MVYSHVSAVNRVAKLAGITEKTGLSLSSIADAIKVSSKKWRLSEQELRSKYRGTALELSSKVSFEVQKKLLAVQNATVSGGLHVVDSAKYLENAYTTLGLTSSGPHLFESLARTASSHAYNAGKYIAEQSPEIQEILWGYTYYCITDDRVREDHLAMDGVARKKDDPIWQRWYPPNGWNCRCLLVPEFEQVKQTRTPKNANPDAGFGVNFGAL
jgi:SPP1 gp7 family putative phage head morphogenesis protein